MAHTPGPWTTRVPLTPITPLAANDRLVLARAFDGSEHVITGRVRGGSPEEADANALLIAAAPDLLSAVKKLRRVVDLGGLDPVDGDYCSILEQADMAIAKAEGSK